MSKQEQFLFGINPVLEKLKASPNDVSQIILTERSVHPGLRAVHAQATRLGLRVTYADPKELNRLAQGKQHQGVLARVGAYSYAAFSDLLGRLSSLSETDWVWLLLMDGLTDPQNFGALLRSAEAVGVRHVVIPKDRSVGVTPTVVKASSGAAHHLNVYRVTNLRRAIEALKQYGVWIVGLDAQGGQGIYERGYPRRLGIVLGSEGRGIRPLIRRQCDYLVSIPMTGKVPSLNVSVAGAVFLYELLRQKKALTRTQLTDKRQ
ncbi:MAG TPA: 23S rRNA (guanosine(2251)-2'-O)-methyltransferase RlmB [Candidatus Binatia bacterium]|nr:23S rRNA (guanosine(2251)-2'-O)-methyltransferase RlmB [Candidatus Binatia bacterium]